MVNWGAVAKAAVLKKRDGERSAEGSEGLPTRSGRWMEKPAKELKFVACVTVTGIPDCDDMMELSCQPPRNASPIPRDATRCPWPAGMSYVPLIEVTFGMSPLEESRSSCGRYVSAAMRLLELGEDNTVVEKTAEASSMSFECV